MHRTLLFGLLLAAVGCDQSEPAQTMPAKHGEVPKKAPEMAPTGIRVVQRDHDDLRKDLTEVEKKVGEGGTPTALELRQLGERVDNLILVTEMAAKAAAKEAVQKRYTAMRQQMAALEKRKVEAYAEVRRIDGFLESKQIPAGFTAEELRDDRADKVKEGQELDAKLQELKKEMKAQEELLAQETVPLEDDIYANELKALQDTRARIEALGS